MKKKPSKGITLEDILADHTLGVRALVQRLREIILETVPTAVEAAYPGWRAIGYRHPGVGYFCGIFPEMGASGLASNSGFCSPTRTGYWKGPENR